jgi:hypothetical protein
LGFPNPLIGNQVRHILIILSIFLFSFTIISCSKSSDDGSKSSDNATTTDNSTTTDTIPPVLAEVAAVTTPTNDSTPDYTFSSDEAGTITYGGSCSSSTISATTDNNTITLVSLSDGTYSDCTITVTDTAGNISNTLAITTFTVETTKPVIAEVTAVTTPIRDSKPNYTFSSTEAGTISYSGSCSSSTTSATTDNNTITLTALGIGTHNDCKITVTDAAGNVSNSLTMTSFVVKLSFIAVGESGTIITSPDGTTWTDSAGGVSTYSSRTKSLHDVTCGKTWNLDRDMFVAVGANGTIFYSTTGKSWGNRDFDTNDHLYGVAYGNNTFLTIGINGRILTNSDGGRHTNWISRSCCGGNKSGVTYGNNIFVMVGQSGNVSTTPDGITWTNSTSNTSRDLTKVVYGNGTFVAVGRYNAIITSPDGTTWTTRTSNSVVGKYEFDSSGFSGVGFGNNTFVAIQSGGNIVRSTDNGTTWTAGSTGTSDNLGGITFGNGTFVTVSGGTILTSSDNGTTWTSRTSGTSKSLYGITYVE